MIKLKRFNGFITIVLSLIVLLVGLNLPLHSQGTQEIMINAIAWSPDGTTIAVGGGLIICDPDLTFTSNV